MSPPLMATLVLLLGPGLADSQHRELVSNSQCYVLSLDTVVHQVHRPASEKSFEASESFVTSALKSTLDSVLDLMVQLPGRDKSSREDRRIIDHFDRLKRGMSRFVIKARLNLTSAWDDLLDKNQRFLNRTDIKPDRLMDSVRRLADTHRVASSAASRQLMVALLEPLKEILKRSAQAIEQMNQKRSVLEDLMPNFLGRLTTRALDSGMDLETPVKVPTDPRKLGDDSGLLLAEELFQAQLLESELGVLMSERRSREAERLELSRRDVAIHWGQEAHQFIHRKKSEETEKTDQQGDIESRVLSLLKLYS